MGVYARAPWWDEIDVIDETWSPGGRKEGVVNRQKKDICFMIFKPLKT